MLKVCCINDNWGDLPEGHFVRKVLLVGDELPVKGRVYEVRAKSFINGKWGYELEGLDYRNYGVIGTFGAARFEIIEDKFVPNHVCQVTGALAYAEKVYIDMSDIPLPKGMEHLTVDLVIDEDTFNVGSDKKVDS